MKILLTLISLMASIGALAQTTNTLAVVLEAGQKDSIELAWKYDTQLRTNGLAPYTNSLPAETFKAFAERVASSALVQEAERIQQQREAEFLDRFRKATAAQRKAAHQALGQ